MNRRVDVSSVRCFFSFQLDQEAPRNCIYHLVDQPRQLFVNGSSTHHTTDGHTPEGLQLTAPAQLTAPSSNGRRHMAFRVPAQAPVTCPLGGRVRLRSLAARRRGGPVRPGPTATPVGFDDVFIGMSVLKEHEHGA